MNPETIPVIGTVFEMGADDRLFDSLLLLGPIVILLIVVLGRTTITGGIASGYILVFVAHIVHNYLRSRSRTPEGESTIPSRIFER